MKYGTRFVASILFVVCFLVCQNHSFAQNITITSIQPDHGSTLGGTNVLMIGTGFTPTTSFSIGGVPCTDVTGTSSTRRRCITTPHSAQLVNVVGRNNGSEKFILSSSYRYVEPPIVSRISPSYGNTQGSTRVVIYGSNFKNGAHVRMDSSDCVDVDVVNENEIQCTTTNHGIGIVDVTVNNTNQVSGTLSSSFEFVQNVWGALTDVNAPSEREFHTAIWTGKEMIVWGGQTPDGPTKTGARYNPMTDTWTPTSLVNAPASRYLHHAIWTGSKMIIWGGEEEQTKGAMYDPQTDTWSAISSLGAPEPRMNSSAVWTGSKMIVWGGHDIVEPISHSDGYAFDPVTNTWSSISNIGAPAPRGSHVAEMVDGLMVIWGGNSIYGTNYYSDGARYNPTTDTWSALNSTNQLIRYSASSVTTSSSMIVWGGRYATLYNTGSIYSSASDTWKSTSIVEAPEPRKNHTAVWTGSKMIVWGGTNDSYREIGNGGVYSPENDSWMNVKFKDAPSKRQNHTAVWTGSSMIIWGGSAHSTYNDGGIYIP